jgi:hypothetical protein
LAKQRNGEQSDEPDRTRPRALLTSIVSVTVSRAPAAIPLVRSAGYLDRYAARTLQTMIRTRGEIVVAWSCKLGRAIARLKIPESVATSPDSADRCLESRSDDGLTEDPPFSAESLQDWCSEKPDGERVEIMIPIVDFAQNTIEWR